MSKDGGRVFPSQYTLPENCGISMRDYFAAHERSEPPISWWQSRCGSQYDLQSKLGMLGGVQLSEGLSEWRYQCADAMLRAREQ